MGIVLMDFAHKARQPTPQCHLVDQEGIRIVK
jgi:hypothetical protein